MRRSIPIVILLLIAALAGTVLLFPGALTRLVFRTKIVVLVQTGTYGSSRLLRDFSGKKYEDEEWLSLGSHMLEHIGRTENAKMTDALVDVAIKNRHDSLMAAAGGALRHFRALESGKRRPIVKLLIKKFTQVYDNANANLDPGDLAVRAFKDRLAAISDPWNLTLKALTGEDFTCPRAWRRFWNKNIHVSWDEREAKLGRK